MTYIHFALLLSLSALLHITTGHTFLTRPDAYNRVFQIRECRGPVCRQACPPLLPPSEMANTRSNPAETWRRGEQLTIKWAKNNHRTGLVRFALVPVNKMMDRSAHERLALYYGCHTQNVFACSGKTCGADRSGEGYSRPKFKIPSIFPDGNYVFGLVWYGGLHFPKKEMRFFSDYWSCSYVRIRGGEQLGGSYQPFFDVGDNREALNHGNRCRTARIRPGQCQTDECSGDIRLSKPKEFKKGKMPSVITPDDVRAVKNS